MLGYKPTLLLLAIALTSGCTLSPRRCETSTDCFLGEVCAEQKCIAAAAAEDTGPSADEGPVVRDTGRDVAAPVDAAVDSGPDADANADTGRDAVTSEDMRVADLPGCAYPEELARWDFRQGSLANMADGLKAVAGLDLVVEGAAAPNFQGPALRTNGGPRIFTEQAADLSPVTMAAMTQDGLTVEVWLTPMIVQPSADTTERRVISWGDSICVRNFAVIWDAASEQLSYRVRDTNVGAGRNGLPTIESLTVASAGDPVHVVLTISGTTGRTALYVDGLPVAPSVVPNGSVEFSQWDPMYQIVVGDEGDTLLIEPCDDHSPRPLAADYHLVAVHGGELPGAAVSDLFDCRTR
jgi:hypothetical protein